MYVPGFEQPLRSPRFQEFQCAVLVHIMLSVKSKTPIKNEDLESLKMETSMFVKVYTNMLKYVSKENVTEKEPGTQLVCFLCIRNDPAMIRLAIDFLNKR